MTFLQYITRLRERLNDMRKTDASACSAITDDGIRWTSAKLIEIANSGLTETVRLMGTYSQSPVIKQIAGSGLGLVTAGTTVTITSGVGSLPTGAIFISELIISSVSYGYIAPDLYLTYFASNKQPRSEGYFFTVLFDTASSTRKIYVLPSTTSGTASVTFFYVKNNYTSSDGASELYLSNVDDILLDVAEREARDREHNWERSKILDIRIATKLGINIGGQ